ncbi:MAG: MMPL family transporter [Solirubrobacteraceae bacterium]
MEFLTDLARLRAKRVLVVAGALFALAGVFGASVVGQLKAHDSDFQDPASQNVQASSLIARATRQSPQLGVVAIVPAADPGLARRVSRLLAMQPGFQRSLDFPSTGAPQLRSRDGSQSAVLAAFDTQERAKSGVDRIRGQLPGVRFGGRDVAFTEISSRTFADLERAELFAFPILLLLSFWVFRGLVAAALPLIVGGLSIISTFVLLRLVSHVTGISIFAVNLVTGLGLGLAIDYSLLIVSRYREEAARTQVLREALQRTLASAGRTVLFSSLTVAAALATLTLFPLRFLYSMGIGGALVALCAGAISLLVLPAVLVALGRHVNGLAPGRLQRSRVRTSTAASSGPWYRLAHGVMRRPGVIALCTAAALLLAAAPALRLAISPAGARVLPTSSQARQVSDTVASQFPSDGSQRIVVLVRGSARHAAALARLAGGLPGGAALLAPRPLDAGVSEFDLLPRGDAISPANQALVRALRALPGPVLVGGPTAAFIDQKSAVAGSLPLVLAILALVTFVVLFLMTGSVVLPLCALLMNVLTVGVAAGLLVLIFQDGAGQSLLGFRSTGGLEEANLVLLFVVSFALSTDYGVFLLARIKEAHDGGAATREAVAGGLERTGRLVTAAALLFCVAIGAFVTSDILFIKQLGVGAALAVGLDATVVRALLLPALMGLLGEQNWWAPRALRAIHTRFGIDEQGLPA